MGNDSNSMIDRTAKKKERNKKKAKNFANKKNREINRIDKLKTFDKNDFLI